MRYLAIGYMSEDFHQLTAKSVTSQMLYTGKQHVGMLWQKLMHT